ncbi:carbohydrate binding domain-containing protein [[Clostridium] polysaccharolyticum]|uniref:Beta-glucanase, GH16 family n=1 Tax=[Clostridium] polysaccharolyticum TaxID=29364 RepID=A0A1H9ZCC0_9FIRM|nr:carbohydrate binding domain-containing protein [[Clostridium] polysaccharolyticum]SES79284.1 Beta-glucanase, GH16 family [[Clostridium] polysaccharolyticum]
MKRTWIKKIAVLMSLALVFSLTNTDVSAAAKKKVSVTKVEITRPVTAVLVLKKGAAYSLKHKVSPVNATDKAVKFTSSNKKAVTVSSKGKLKAVKNGTAKITVTANNKKKDSITVKVGTPITGVKLSKSSVSLVKGDSYTLTASVQPSNATYKKVSYVSSNTKVAVVTSTGKITAKGTGTAAIKVKTLDGSCKSRTCTVKVSAPNAYKLVFQDDFNGTELNKKNWNYETHEPGWVNNELQEYTDSKDNIYVKDGKLVIKANKTKKTVDGKEVDWYTSGKVTSQKKQDFKYGKFVIKAKGVEGQGLWPAIWMMPREENFYGQWPRCGEIDIMELLGHEPDVHYSTIHYGNPHNEQQGVYKLEKGSFADSYHVYELEWEPSYMCFYVDGHLVKKVTDWYTATEGKGEVTFPAPFDQYFYLQFNLAVGGNWPGNPDATTNFDNAKFMIDYVKVYQKAKYDENVKKPEKPPVVLRDPDGNGNYIVNGDFSKQEELADDIGWGEKYANGGAGKVILEDGKMVIKTEDAGSVDYSVQIVQPNLPMKKGGQYKLTFDAYADEARTMIADVSGPDRSYVRYFNDTKVELTKESKPYSFDFTMEQDDDANGRLEFNLGNQGSKAAVYISNVKLVKTGQTEIKPPAKTVLMDGNYVYNGEFQEGSDRMLYWTVKKAAGTSVEVTNVEGRRELKVTAPSTAKLNDVLVKQDVAISANKSYLLTFDGYAEKAKTAEVRVAGKTFKINLTTVKKQFKFKVETGDKLANKDLIFALGTAGPAYIDNVRLADDALLVNGDFISDFVGWTPFADGGISSSVSYTVDSQKENQAAAFEIKDTGDQDWKVQLMQDGINLVKGKTYKLTFEAKTDLAGGRKIVYNIGHNGSSDNDWTSYSTSKLADLTSSYQKFNVEFTMESASDAASRLSFSMGAVDGKQIKTTHNIYIDNITLEEIEK